MDVTDQNNSSAANRYDSVIRSGGYIYSLQPYPGFAEKGIDDQTFSSSANVINNVCITAWRDNKLVVAASTAKGVEPCHQVLRFSRKEKRRISLPCPDVIHHYNHSMGGVDLSDSHVARCRSSIRGKKWYFPIFIYLFDLSVSNAWILYRLAAGSSVDLASFKAEIASILLRSNRKGRATTLSIDCQSRFDRIDHLVINNDRQARCGVCSKCTNFHCKKCHKFLHPKLCFESFHTK